MPSTKFLSIFFTCSTYLFFCIQPSVFPQNKISLDTLHTHQLPHIVINEKGKNAKGIIRKIEKNFNKNYNGIVSFVQKMKITSVISNFDSVKSSTSSLLTDIYESDQGQFYLTSYKSDTIYNDNSFIKFIKVPRLLKPIMDIFRENLSSKKNRYDYNNFKLVGKFHDDKYGTLYKIAYTIKKDSLNQGKLIYCIGGDYLVSEKDFAIIQVNQKWVFNDENDRAKTGLYEMYHNKNWNAQLVSKIVEESVVWNVQCNYEKDKESGKYFTKNAFNEYFQKGYQIETNIPVYIHYRFDITTLNIENVLLEKGRY